MSIRNRSRQCLFTGLLALIPLSLICYFAWSPLMGFLLALFAIPLWSLRAQAMIYFDIRRVTGQVDALMGGGSLDKSLITGEGDLMALYARLTLLNDRLLYAAEQKQRDKQAMQRFVEDVAHQLKTPLSSLRLKLEARQMESQEPWLEECIAPVDRMTFLIQSLMTITRLEAGTLRMAFADAKVCDTVDMAVRALSETVGKRNQRVMVTGERSLRFRHDPRWLMEALENLIKNASAHSPAGSEITVSYGLMGEDAQPMLRIQVADHGEGIRKEELPRVFDRFYQGAGSRKTEGAGIGLSLAKAIAEAHHGDIRAMNLKEGGAAFLLLLPGLSGSVKEEA